jgi:hypothetical protein
MTLADLIAAHGLGFSCERLGPKIYRCRITCEARGMNFFHRSSTAPTLAEVITRLAKAAQQHVDTKLPNGLSANRDEASFRHWCALYGHDPMSHDDHERYRTIRRRAEQLKYVIGIPAYRELLETMKGGP